jgi:hypothetical protein
MPVGVVLQEHLQNLADHPTLHSVYLCICTLPKVADTRQEKTKRLPQVKALCLLIHACEYSIDNPAIHFPPKLKNPNNR